LIVPPHYQRLPIFDKNSGFPRLFPVGTIIRARFEYIRVLAAKPVAGCWISIKQKNALQ
jgi:hypothetical protein